MPQVTPSKRETCWDCQGYGIVCDYGAFGEDFYGDKECPTCHGRGDLRARDEKGRFCK